jgi:hypothetical protein
MRIPLCAVVAIAVLDASEVRAWNALGHKVVAEIAWRQLKPAERQPIVDTLRRHPRFDADFVAKMEDDAAKGGKDVQDHWIFLHAATWPDVARNIPGEDKKKYDRPTWHYINLPLFLDPGDQQALAGRLRANISTEYPTRTPPADYNVIQAIAYCRATIAGKAGPGVKALAYCWLMHLVGDIHQPLHAVSLYSAAHLPKGDDGGNEIPLAKGENLHKVWDNLLGRQHYLRNVQRTTVELSDRRRYRAAWESAARKTDPVQWAHESRDLCESFVYSPGIRSAIRSTPAGSKLAPIQLPESYLQESGAHARQRIVVAGVRLGPVLRELVTGSESRDRVSRHSGER